MKIIKTNTFNKQYSKLDSSIQNLIKKQIKIVTNQKKFGKPLYKNIIFERKVESYRIYFIVLNQSELVLIFVSIAKKHSKKSQQEDIEFVKKILKIYLKEFQL